jgi:ubiquinone biosynthesis protein
LPRDIATYEWAAAHLEALGGEAGRLRPRMVIANFKRWTLRELDLRREAASASELADLMKGHAGYRVPSDRLGPHQRPGDDHRLDRRHQDQRYCRARCGRTLIAKICHRAWSLAFLTQAISGGYFHADMHQGNLFVEADGTIAAIDFGIMGRIDRRARLWLAEILYGLTTGNYRRVAEIHFEAQVRAKLPFGRRIRDGAARGGRADARAPGQRTVGRADARWPVRDHPRFRHADPAAPAAAAKDDGHGRRARHPARSPKSTCGTSPRPSYATGSATSLAPKPRLPTGCAKAPKPCCACPIWSAGSRKSSRQKAARPKRRRCPKIELVWDRREGGRKWPGYLLALLAGGAAMWGAQALGWL